MKKLEIVTEKWVLDKEVTTEVNIPEEPIYLFITGCRIAFSIKPTPTYTGTDLAIVGVDPNDHIIKKKIISVWPSAIQSALNDTKTWYYEALELILNHEENYYRVERRTKKEFMKDYNETLEEINRIL